MLAAFGGLLLATYISLILFGAWCSATEWWGRRTDPTVLILAGDGVLPLSAADVAARVRMAVWN